MFFINGFNCVILKDMEIIFVFNLVVILMEKKVNIENDFEGKYL